MKPFLTIPLLATGLAMAAAPSSADPGTLTTTGVVSAFTLVVPESVSASTLQARAVIPAGVPCPDVEVERANGKKDRLAMTRRAPGATTKSAFASVRACQADLPRGLRSAAIAGQKIPADLPKRVDEIALIGDTGCRVVKKFSQDCADPAAWPLAANSRSLAKDKPDMVVFTGDFYYREAPCPEAFADRCGGSPPPLVGSGFNDTDYGWMADVFVPMAPMLRAAPILALRGNHESCSRGGNGYFLFFDASDLGPEACAPKEGAMPKNVVPSWSVDVPVGKGRTLRTVVVDSAYGANFDLTDWVPTQRTAYADAEKLTGKKTENWLLTHRPMFGVDTVEESNGKPSWNQWTSVDQTAAARGLIERYDLMVASHIHVAQVAQIPGEAAQLVVGNGGSVPDAPDGYSMPKYGPLRTGEGVPMSQEYPPYPDAEYLWTAAQYGYTIATPGKADHRWTFAQKDTAGKTFATCSLKGKKMRCR